MIFSRISGGTLPSFVLIMFSDESEVFEVCSSESSLSLDISPSEAFRIMLIFLDKGTGGVEGCEAFMLNFELCLIIRDLLEELPRLVSSLLISDRLALGASGELTGLLLLLLDEFVFDAGFKNFMKSLDLDFLSAFMLLLG